MSLYPIYIDSSVAGAQLSIGTTNASTIIIGAPTTSIKNTSTVINGIRLDSNKNASNMIMTFANSAITPMNGINNTIISDGLSVNTGSYNTAVGSGTLLANTVSSNNTAVGFNALKVNTGANNTAIGSNALQSNVSGNWNTAVGYLALAKSTGDSNVAIGDETYDNLTGTDSRYNVGVGTRTCKYYTSGSYNTMIGYSTNDNVSYTSGSYNTCIGHGTNTSDYSYSTAIGVYATCTASNQIMIGTTAQTTQIGNTRISNGGNNASVYISTKFKNNVLTAPTAYQGDSIFTTGDSYDSSVSAGSTAYARPLIINGADIIFNPTSGFPNNTGKAGDVIIRGGAGNIIANDGTAAQSLVGGNVYIDGGGGYCPGGNGNTVNVTPGSVVFRTGAQKIGNTYFGNGTQTTLMTVAPTGITTNVSMRIYEEVGTGSIIGGIDTMGPSSGSLVIQHNNPGGASSIVFPSRTNSTDYGYIRYRDNVDNVGGGIESSRLEIGAENDGTASGDCLILNKNGAYVGIGTTGPQYNLDVTGTARVTGATTLAALTASGATSLQNTTISGTLGVGTTTPVRTFSVTGKVSIGDNSHDSGEYATVNICSDSRSYPQLSLIRGGNTAWQLGTIGTGNNFNIFCSSNGVALATGASSWSAFSDRNLKTNFEDIEEPIKKINKIKGLYYKLKTDTPEEMRRVGVIAQDVQSVLPEAITELFKNDEPYLGVKYTELIPLLIEGIKSQQGMIDLQEKENDELKNEQKLQQDKITSLESKVELLQKQMVDILDRLK